MYKYIFLIPLILLVFIIIIFCYLLMHFYENLFFVTDMEIYFLICEWSILTNNSCYTI